MIRAHHRARHVSSVSHWASGSPRCPPYAAPLAVAIFCSPPLLLTRAAFRLLQASSALVWPFRILRRSTFLSSHPLSFFPSSVPTPIRPFGGPTSPVLCTRRLTVLLLLDVDTLATLTPPSSVQRSLGVRSTFLPFYHRHPTPRHDGLGVHQGDACLAPRQRGRMGARHCHLGSDTWRSEPRL